MTKKISIVEAKDIVGMAELRNKYRSNTYGGMHTRDFEISKESKDKADMIFNSSGTMLSIYNRIVNDSDSIVSPYKIIRKIYREFIDIAEKNYELNDEIDTAIYNRVKNAVKGFIAQDNAIPLFLEVSDDLLILTNESLDINGGVDFIVITLSTNMAYFIHVTTLGEGEESVKEKENKCSKRNFGTHCLLFYSSKEDCELSFLINEIAFFKRNYIVDCITDWKEDQTKGMRIDGVDFKKEFMKYNGEWKLFKSSELRREYENEVEELIAFLEQ